uniref:WD_REPEATS_REGION domain-containing protein n=1 Tax=Panagrellus redivivus TaxID=6233 RepID=A0A7E4W876_PANRE
MGQMSSTPPSVPSPAAVVASQANFRQNNGSVTPILMPATAPPSLAAAAAIAAHYRRLEGDRRRSSASNDDSDEYLSAPDRRIRHRNRSRDRRSLTSDSEDGSDRPPFVNPLWSGRRNLVSFDFHNYIVIHKSQVPSSYRLP